MAMHDRRFRLLVCLSFVPSLPRSLARSARSKLGVGGMMVSAAWQIAIDIVAMGSAVWQVAIGVDGVF